MSSMDTLPGLNDQDLATLHANAIRLGSSEGRHRKAAAELLPVIEAELAARTAARPAVVSKARRPRTPKLATATNPQ